jgi:curved DNA-binding protein CbpA
VKETMPCIHGLDEINCPTCRILKSAAPLNGIKLKKLRFPTFNDSISKKNLNLEKKLIDEVSLKNRITRSPNLISKPTFINDVPNFRNELFLERSKELDISKEDNYGITKKIPLENPEWKFDEEE